MVTRTPTKKIINNRGRLMTLLASSSPRTVGKVLYTNNMRARKHTMPNRTRTPNAPMKNNRRRSPTSPKSPAPARRRLMASPNKPRTPNAPMKRRPASVRGAGAPRRLTPRQLSEVNQMMRAFANK